MSSTFAHVLPEVILAVGALLLTLLGAFREKQWSGLIFEGAVVFLGAALVLELFQTSDTFTAFNGLFVDDEFARFMKALSLIGAIGTLLLSHDYMRREKIEGFEYSVLITLSTLGMMIMISATNLISLYLGLELMSLSLYVVAAFHRDDLAATEAGLKYFVLGALSSGMLLYGASLIYGFAGSIFFIKIAETAAHDVSLTLIFGIAFLLAGLAFKMSAVPFHMWTPDVYQGAPTPVTAFFASAPKMAAVAITVRTVFSAFPHAVVQWQQIIIFISIASMLLGSFAAIGQSNFKRLMAYSSIGHMGFALVGLAAGTSEGATGITVYMMMYLLMTLGTFAAIIGMRVDGKAVEKIADLAGLAKNDSGMALCLTMLMFSLMGMPLFAGFIGKFYVFSAVVKAGLYPMAVIGMLASVVAAYYYLRVIKIMWFDDAAPAFDRKAPAVTIVMWVAALLNLLLGILPGPFYAAASAAAKSLF
ncbi:NADH-quinone oxidoreductase subunit NuoN [Methylovirgula sp. 4M-Z18]|uniref:NADH-quinone oxidoreductase subunit NuoN n=1 Tax=Methylovirgula sp. 4M-Z18 TaxID=2293567 RepID=UPI000E2E5BFC|nr:NADH-quinone oxidoreductase subunit NuoN [Methylovirgula sp. 4M-Z18]RFB80484.1 NADH-quinone oxidoreductase subunit NuoN [Methylovirgula sp. 4M-Z18]